MLGAEDQVIAHPPVFKIFDLAQIAVGFRDERRPARCLLMSALGQKRTSVSGIGMQRRRTVRFTLNVNANEYGRVCNQDRIRHRG